MCFIHSQVKHVIHAVEIYQLRGMDFTEEVNLSFIMACIRMKNPKAAADLIVPVLVIHFAFIFYHIFSLLL